MRTVNARESLTDREREEFEQEKEIAKLQADYQVTYKTLDIELQRQQMRWAQIFRLPFVLLTLPVRLIMAVGYVVHAVKGTQPDEKFWDYLTKF